MNLKKTIYQKLALSIALSALTAACGGSDNNTTQPSTGAPPPAEAFSKARCKPRYKMRARRDNEIFNFDNYLKRPGYYVLTEVEDTTAMAASGSNSKTLYFGITYNSPTDGRVEAATVCDDTGSATNFDMAGSAGAIIEARGGVVNRGFSFDHSDYNFNDDMNGKSLADIGKQGANPPAGMEFHAYSIDQDSFEIRMRMDSSKQGGTVSMQFRFVFRYLKNDHTEIGPSRQSTDDDDQPAPRPPHPRPRPEPRPEPQPRPEPPVEPTNPLPPRTQPTEPLPSNPPTVDVDKLCFVAPSFDQQTNQVVYAVYQKSAVIATEPNEERANQKLKELVREGVCETVEHP